MKVSTHLLNPIGIIALFAALCEASATTVLPYLDNDNRQIYIWFLIIFPSALVVMFFLTLNFNCTVLYGPHENTNTQPPPPPTTESEEMNHPPHDRQPE